MDTYELELAVMMYHNTDWDRTGCMAS